MKLKRKLLWYDFLGGLGYIITGLLWVLSAILFLYLVDIGVISKDTIDILMGILVLTMSYPICKYIGLFVDKKTLERCMKFLDTLVETGDLVLHVEDRVVVDDIRKEALDSRFVNIKIQPRWSHLIHPRWSHLEDNYVYINLHKILLDQPDAKKIIVTKRYYEIKKVDFTYYAILKRIVDKVYKEDVKII